MTDVKRALVDQDITPTGRITEQLPGSWEVAVGIDAGGGDALVEAFEGVNVAFVTSRVPVSRGVIEAASALEVVAKIGTGIDNVDLDAAEERGVVVTYTPGHNALSVAEHTLCLVLAAARRLTEARSLLESGGWRDEVTLGTQLSGSTVGIVGFGDVGKRVGGLLSGFDVDLLVYDPYVPDVDAELVGGQPTSLGDLLRRSDVVTVNAELTEETRGMIGEGELSAMKESALLVNTARGAIVEEDALLDALRSGSIAGAGLDVFATEPLDPDDELLARDDVVLTPHVAGMTNESRAETIDRIAENAVAIVEGTPVPERYLATAG